jgi:hypothetical protein
LCKTAAATAADIVVRPAGAAACAATAVEAAAPGVAMVHAGVGKAEVRAAAENPAAEAIIARRL